MKNILTYLILIFLISCSSKKQKEKLIGNWYSNSNENYGFVEFQFYNDSLIIYDEMLGKFSQEWEVNKDKIYLTNIKGLTTKKQLTYSYKLDKSNRFLYLKALGDTIIELPKLSKAKNPFDFLKKIFGLKIELPTKQTKLVRIGFPGNLNFNIYAGYNKDNKLAVKTDLSSDLNNLENEVIEFKNNSRDEFKNFLRFNLIADKNINESQIDSIKKILKSTLIKQVYRTYKSKEADYENNLNWFGQKE
ncbi:hypothetical protein LG651_02115 [Tamlana sp. 62-3]|uniref:Lipoprotein n=1 Tax=Neotamlana sargassicola TaxID=2883125 RepID=A0A9X1I5D7_9FLAO|nr:hypothetical protein [Tamlana sargassicola]MCB4807029.1 hypothetical protein [Tamlana sargassicola]